MFKILNIQSNSYIGLQKNCTATHTKAMFLAEAKSHLEFETLRLGQLQYFWLSHN